MSRLTPERIEEIRSATAGNVLTPRDGWRGVVMELLAEIDALQEELQSAHAVLVDSGDDAQALAALIENELGKWDLHHGAQDRHFLAIGLAHALVRAGVVVLPPDPSEEMFEAGRTAFNAAIKNWHWDEAFRISLRAALAVLR